MAAPDKLIPQNIEAEEAILGALLIDPEALFRVAPFLKADDYYIQKNAWIYEAILALHERREPVDFVTLCDELERKEQLEGGPHIIRRREARKKANQELKNAKKLVFQTEDGELYRQLSRAVKGLIGDKLNISALAYTPAEIRRCLEQQGWQEQTAQEVAELLEQLEYCQYVSATGESGTREAQYNKARQLVALLDKKL